MKNLIITSIFFLVSFISFSQKISINVTEVKDYFHSDSVDYKTAILKSRSNNSKREVNGSYQIDLKTKKMSFTSLNSSGKRKIKSSSIKDSVITITYEDYHLNGDKKINFEVLMVIDQIKNKVIFTYYDPLYNYTMAQDFTKNKVLVSK